jgi:ABC-type enterochelin transport system permease subunit
MTRHSAVPQGFVAMTHDVLVMTVGLFILAFISGMLGLGVAFAAIPFLGLFLPDLVHYAIGHCALIFIAGL